jgi:hypothetical protein
MKKIYLFKLVGEDLDDNMEHPFYFEFAQIIGDENTKYIGVTNQDDLLITLDDLRIEKITSLMQKYFIISKTDVTEKVLSGEMQREYPEVEPSLFENYRLENTTKDAVLDKINSLGIGSLDDIDKIILESN